MQIIDDRPITRNMGGETPCRLRFGFYPNRQVALQLFCEDTGEPWCTASTTVQAAIPEDCMAIKDYSANEGMVDLLLRKGIIEGDPVTHAASGFVRIPVYRLTKTVLESLPARR